jgi:hypothetical protein
MRGNQPGPRWVKAVDRNPPVNTRLHLKVKGVNHVGFWDAPANCYVTFLDNAYPITDVEWLDESDTPEQQSDAVEEIRASHRLMSKAYAEALIRRDEANWRVEKMEKEHADLNLALAAMLNGYQNLSMYQRDWFTVPKDLIDTYTKMVLEYEPKQKEDK